MRRSRRRTDLTLTIAICGSLAAHALVLGGAAEVYTRSVRFFWPGDGRNALSSSLLLVPAMPEDDPHEFIGEAGAHGQFAHASPGDRPLEAREGPTNQADLSLDPSGASGQAQASALNPQAQVTPPAEQPSAPPPTPFGIPDEPGDLHLPIGQSRDEPRQLAKAPEPQSIPEPQPPAPSPSEPVPMANVAPPGDPSPQGESESDPISTVGSAVFRRGATDVRAGRKVKLIRPILSLASQADLLTVRRPIVVLKLKTDADGKVSNVEVYQSSGSRSLDQDVKLAAFRWWFEPPTDAKGKPVADVFLFPVGYIS